MSCTRSSVTRPCTRWATRCTAIAKLGAQREGVLRRHIKREDGTFRDCVVYSVLKDEWPQVKQRLTSRLQ
jgi:hypothetical protein